MEAEDDASEAVAPEPVGITDLPAVWPVDFVEARTPTTRVPSLSAEAQLNLDLLLRHGGARMVTDDPDWRSPYGFPQIPQVRMPAAHASYLLNLCLGEQRGVGGTEVGVTGAALMGDLAIGIVDNLLHVLRIWESCPHGFWAVSQEAIDEHNPEPFRCASC